MSEVRKFPKDVEKTRTIPFVFSDETKDSYGTVFTAKDWDLDRFNKNGIAFFMHASYSSDPNMAIGSGRAWIEGNKLLGEITFEPKELNPVADTVFRKFLNGTYKGVSIRFNPLENGKWGEGEESFEGSNPTYYIGRRELVEISVAPLPSNKNALIRSYCAELTAEDKPDEMYFTSGQVRTVDEEGETGEGTTETEDEPKVNNEETYARALMGAAHVLTK